MGRFVIAAFKPKPGMTSQLTTLVEKHWSVLSGRGLVTTRPRYAMQAEDGTLLEVFEWLSPEAIEKAHKDPLIQKLWQDFEAICEYVPLASLPEASHPFSEFEPCNF